MSVVRLRSKSPHEVELRHELGRTVKPEQVIEVPGVLAKRTEGAPDDAHVVINDGEERAWPKSLWSLVAQSKSDAKSEE